MIRNDFVSNSSSCSFFIHLQSQKDVDEFKSIFDKLYNLNIGMAVYLDPYHYLDFINAKTDVEKIHKGDYIRLDAGEDHYKEIIDRYDEMCDIIDECPYKFKEYKDIDAHYTRGKNWKESDDD